MTFSEVSYHPVRDGPPLAQPPNGNDILSNTKVSQIMQNVLKQKQQNYVSKKTGSLGCYFWKYYPPMIGGDIATMIYAGFLAVQYLLPSIAAMKSVALVSSFFGVLGGVFNFFVGIQSLKEGFEELQGEDKVKAFRLIWDGVIFILISFIMQGASIAEIMKMSAIIAFFAAHPWLLPVLFFLASAPIFYEVFSRSARILFSRDYGTQLAKDLKDSSQMTIEKMQNILKTRLFHIDENDNVEKTAKEAVLKEIFKASKSKYSKERASAIYESIQSVMNTIQESDIQTARMQYQEQYLVSFSDKDIIKLLLSKKTEDVLNKFDKDLDNLEEIEPFIKDSFVRDRVLFEIVSEKMEKLQAAIGVEAALRVFTLFTKFQEKIGEEGNIVSVDQEYSMAQFTKQGKEKSIVPTILDKKLPAWNRSQYLRSIQQIFFIVSFTATMTALLPVAATIALPLLTVNAIMMSLANAIPAYMDIFWPFRRNVALAVGRAGFDKTKKKQA